MTRGTPNRVADYSGRTTRGTSRGLILRKVSLQATKHPVITKGKMQGVAVREEEGVVVTEVATRPPEGTRGVDVVQISQIRLPIRNPHH